MICPACGRNTVGQGGSCPFCENSINAAGALDAWERRTPPPFIARRREKAARVSWWKGLDRRAKEYVGLISVIALVVLAAVSLAGVAAASRTPQTPGPVRPPVEPVKPAPVPSGRPVIETVYLTRMSILSVGLGNVLESAYFSNAELRRQLTGITFTETVGSTGPARLARGLLCLADVDIICDGGLEKDNDERAVEYCNNLAAQFRPGFTSLREATGRMLAVIDKMRAPGTLSESHELILASAEKALASLDASLAATALLEDTDAARLAEAQAQLDMAESLEKESAALLGRTAVMIDEEIGGREAP